MINFKSPVWPGLLTLNTNTALLADYFNFTNLPVLTTPQKTVNGSR